MRDTTICGQRHAWQGSLGDWPSQRGTTDGEQPTAGWRSPLRPGACERRLPLAQGRDRIQMPARGMLDRVHVHRGSGEERGNDQRKQSERLCQHHAFSLHRNDAAREVRGIWALNS